MKTLVKPVAYYSDSGKVRDAVLKSDAIRHCTLDACYAIPGYSNLPLDAKNRIYDSIKSGFKKGCDY